MKLTLRHKLIDFYLAKPIICDAIFIIIILLGEHFAKTTMIKGGIPLIRALDVSKESGYFSSVISTIVALAGFMVAALTIMITVKASLKARGFKDAGNALEYIFTTKHYASIVHIFTVTIIELIILLICSYFMWLYSENVTNITLSKFLFCAVFATSISITRSISIFFGVLSLENIKKDLPEIESTEEKQTRLLEEILKKLSENR